jgi:hypothetical protein
MLSSPDPRTPRSSLRLIFLAAFLIVIVTPVGLAAGLPPQSAVPARSLEGTWTGILGGQLHLVVTIAKSPDGGYTGDLNSVDQHATLALAAITLKEDTARFEVPRVGGVYEGQLNPKGDAISGSWVQTSTISQPLYFTRTSSSSEPQQSTSTPAAPPEHTAKPKFVAINAVPSIIPQAFQADGKWHVVYELHISSLDKRDYRFTRLEILDSASQKTLASFGGADLDKMFVHPGLGETQPAAKLTGGQFAVVYVWLDFNRREDVPAAISQRITAKIGDYPEEMSVITPPVPINRDPVAVVASPLTGSDWVAANGPSNSSAHRRALIPINAHAYISQRFAIDWVEMYPDGKTYKGDPLDNKNYRCYGQEIHSVADGVVTETKDGIPQNVPDETKRAVEITLETVGGNHVIVDIGHGHYAFYAHMQPGSLRVKVGDKVVAGQVLGLVGNTGNSTEPHLHFHICDASSPLGCEGLPYAFSSFDLQGVADNWKPSEPHAAPVKHELEIPTEDEIVSFPAAAK